MKLLTIAFSLYTIHGQDSKCEDDATKAADLALAPFADKIKEADDNVTKAKDALAKAQEASKAAVTAKASADAELESADATKGVTGAAVTSSTLDFKTKAIGAL